MFSLIIFFILLVGFPIFVGWLRVEWDKNDPPIVITHEKSKLVLEARNELDELDKVEAPTSEIYRRHREQMK